MASSEDKNFSRGLDSASCRGRSKAQMSVSKILDTISAAAAAAPNSQPSLRQDEGESLAVGGNVERRGLLNIDLNVAPPEDGDSEPPEAECGGNGRPTAAADVAPENKVEGSANENDLNFNGDCENRSGIQAHWSEAVENGEKPMKTKKINADSEAEVAERDRGNRGWKTLLEVAETALREHEENLRNRDEKTQNRKRRPSRELELGGGPARKKIAGPRRQSVDAAGWNDDSEVAAVVVRSTRGRAVAMPNKYRDSVLDAVAVAEAELPRHNKSGKSATVVSTKRKSR